MYSQKFYSSGTVIPTDAKLPKCPRCDTEVTKIVKQWDYSIFHVKKFNCETCNRNFNAYFKRGKLSYTIPRTLKPEGELRVSVEKRRIIEYLRKHNEATEDEIAHALDLNVADVLKMLIELEGEGSIERVDDT